MLRRIIAIVLVLVGAAMIIVAVTAKRFFAPQSYWSDQQAQEYVSASTALKSAATGTIRQPSAASDPKLAAAQERFKKIQAQLDWAITRRSYTGVTLGAAGAALLVIGVGVFLRGHETAEKSPEDEKPFIRR